MHRSQRALFFIIHLLYRSQDTVFAIIYLYRSQNASSMIHSSIQISKHSVFYHLFSYINLKLKHSIHNHSSIYINIKALYYLSSIYLHKSRIGPFFIIYISRYFIFYHPSANIDIKVPHLLLSICLLKSQNGRSSIHLHRF